MKEQIEKAKAAVEEVKAKVEIAEQETDSFLVRLANRKDTVFILGAAVGAVFAFLTIAC